jgi:hypothetical protein
MADAIKIAVPETIRDRNIIPISSRSKLEMRENAFIKPSTRKFMVEPRWLKAAGYMSCGLLF